MFAVVDRQQWNTQRAAEPPLSPSCNRCSLLRVAWATRCDRSRDASTLLDRRRVLDRPPRIRIIALHLDHVTIPGLNVSAVVSWDTLKFVAPNRTHLSHSGQVDGWTGRMDPSEIVEDLHWETKYRRDLTHTGLYVIDSDHASSFSVISAVHPDNSIIPTSGGVSSSDLVTGHLFQPPTRVADIQINATAATLQNRPLYRSEEGQQLQTPRRWRTTWNSFQLARRRKYLKQKFRERDRRSYHHPDARIHYVTRICYAYLRNGTLVFGGLDRRPFSRFLGGLRIFSDSYVRHFLSKPSTCRRTIGRTPDYSKDATQREWYGH